MPRIPGQSGLNKRRIPLRPDGSLSVPDLYDHLDEVDRYMRGTARFLSALETGGQVARETLQRVVIRGGAAGGGGAVGIHKDLLGLQGGTPPNEFYHFNELHHHQLGAALGWVPYADYLTVLYATQFMATSGLQWPIEGVRTTDETAIGQAGVLAKAVSSGNMADGFGPGYVFAIQDDAAVENVIAAIYAVRAGADSTGDMSWRLATAGTLNERMRLTAAGALSISAGLTATGATLSGLTAGRVVYPGAGGVLSGSANLFWDNANAQLLLGVGSAALPSYSFIGRTTDGSFSPEAGALGWAIAGAEKMRLTATGLGIGCTPAYPLDVLGNARVTGGVNVGAATTAIIGRVYADDGTIGYFGHSATDYIRFQAGLCYLYLGGVNQVYWSNAGTYFSPYTDNALTLGRDIRGWAALHLADAAHSPAANGEVRASTTVNAFIGRMGDTPVRLGGTVDNLSEALGEFLSGTIEVPTLVHTMWSKTVDKDFWVTGKPINVFAICRYRLPAYDAPPSYDCKVEILLGTEVLVERTISHTGVAPGISGYYYVELHSRVTKYANNNLRLVSRVKQSGNVAFANWVEGTPLGLVETALGRADPVVLDVTTANLTLQVRVTFSRPAAGLRCLRIDAGWEAAG